MSHADLRAEPSTAAPTPAREATAPGSRRSPLALGEVRWAAVSLVFFAVAAPVQVLGAPTWTWAPLYAVCYLAGGWEPALSGLQALRDRTLDVDLLMIVAAIGAAAIGQVFDGALLIVIFATSGALEAWATARTESSVRSLLELSPDRASRLDPYTGEEEEVAAGDLVVGDLILVRPGEAVGADGAVRDGVSDVDQAGITGEPLPAAKRPGDEVFAGTVNGTGALHVRVTRDAGESVVARIAALVEQAAATKARTQRFVETVEQRYSVGVVVATLAIFVVPLCWGEALTAALLRAMTFMIVASPCAIVLSTMPPLLAAVATAGRHGVLVKSARVLEDLGSITTVALDKTGTLTEGRPELTAVHLLPGGRLAGWSGDRALSVAAAAEVPSEHPLARAVVAGARARTPGTPEATDFVALPGRGVRATVAGVRIAVGGPAGVLPELDLDLDERTGVQHVVDGLEEAGHTAVVVAADGRAVAALALTDTLRPAAHEAVAALTVATGRSPILLTGDNAHAAAAVARSVGIEDVRAGLLPADKTAAVDALRADGQRVLVAGDGVNDAPALATADVGVGMGGAGSDLTLQAADVIVVRDELDALPALLGLARRARRVVVANLALAATIVVGLVVWDLVGHLPLPLGVAGHEGSTVLVGLNGLRLLRARHWGVPSI